jgi:hypothetical protein
VNVIKSVETKLSLPEISDQSPIQTNDERTIKKSQDDLTSVGNTELKSLRMSNSNMLHSDAKAPKEDKTHKMQHLYQDMISRNRRNGDLLAEETTLRVREKTVSNASQRSTGPVLIQNDGSSIQISLSKAGKKGKELQQMKIDEETGSCKQVERK